MFDCTKGKNHLMGYWLRKAIYRSLPTMDIKIKKVSAKILLFLIVLFVSSLSFAQGGSLDSMKKSLKNQPADTNMVNTLIQISANLYNQGNSKEALAYLKQLVRLSEKIKFNQGQAIGYFLMILVYNSQNNYIELLNNSYKAMEIYKKIKDSLLLAETLQYVGATNFIIGDTIEALINYKASLEIRKKLNNKSGITQSYNSIGEIYCKQGKFDEAMKLHTGALEIIKDTAFKGIGWEKAYSYQCIGNIYDKKGDKARTNGDSRQSNQLFQKALKQYEFSYEIWQKLPWQTTNALAELDYVIGNVNLKLDNFKLAEEKIQKSLKIFLQMDNKELLNEVYLSLSLLDSAKGNYKSAYEHYKSYVFYKKINDDQDIIRKAEGFKMKSQFEKKETELKLASTESKLQAVIAKDQNQKKNMAYTGICLILLGGGYGFYRFRKRKRKQSKEALTNERLRISQELHDEVGATLSGISMYSHLTKEQIKHAQTAEVEKSLNIIQQSAGDMVNKLNDIVWFINPDQDTLQRLMQRLEEYAGDMAAIKNMQVKISVPQQFSTQSLPVESRRNIYLFCKEAINNAVKYSEANLLQVTVKENNHLLEITISDNGKGCDIDTIKRGNGLNNMQKRADELSAGFTIQSNLPKGCLILLKVKIT